MDMATERGTQLAMGNTTQSPSHPLTMRKSGTAGATALKPAYEPIILARKPCDGTVASNVLKHGTGAINIDACRVSTDDNLNGGRYSHDREVDSSDQWRGGRMTNYSGKYAVSRNDFVQPSGRFPANFCHDGSQMVLDLFPDGTGASAPLRGTEPSRTGAHGIYNAYGPHAPFVLHDKRGGSAARFFYCAKASRSERGEGNDHPTVKPLALMRWLVRLVTRKGGLVLDPFCGSGTTGLACAAEGMRFVGIEKDSHYAEIAR